MQHNSNHTTVDGDAVASPPSPGSMHQNNDTAGEGLTSFLPYPKLCGITRTGPRPDPGRVLPLRAERAGVFLLRAQGRGLADARFLIIVPLSCGAGAHFVRPGTREVPFASWPSEIRAAETSEALPGELGLLSNPSRPRPPMCPCVETII